MKFNDSSSSVYYVLIFNVNVWLQSSTPIIIIIFSKSTHVFHNIIRMLWLQWNIWSVWISFMLKIVTKVCFLVVWVVSSSMWISKWEFIPLEHTNYCFSKGGAPLFLMFTFLWSVVELLSINMAIYRSPIFHWKLLMMIKYFIWNRYLLHCTQWPWKYKFQWFLYTQRS